MISNYVSLYEVIGFKREVQMNVLIYVNTGLFAATPPSTRLNSLLFPSEVVV